MTPNHTTIFETSRPVTAGKYIEAVAGSLLTYTLSSSDILFISRMSSKTTPTLATHNVANQPPIVLPGDLTPGDFELVNTKAIRYHTSPIRHRGLSHIPNEIYMEIFKYLRPPEDKPRISLAAEYKPWTDDLAIYRRNFSRVALVCRSFHSVILPWIFESTILVLTKQNGPSLNYARSIINGCGLWVSSNNCDLHQTMFDSGRR